MKNQDRLQQSRERLRQAEEQRAREAEIARCACGAQVRKDQAGAWHHAGPCTDTGEQRHARAQADAVEHSTEPRIDRSARGGEVSREQLVDALRDITAYVGEAMVLGVLNTEELNDSGIYPAAVLALAGVPQ